MTIQCITGFRTHQDKLDGYYFFFPENWLPVTVRLYDSSNHLVACKKLFVTVIWRITGHVFTLQTSGNDIFYRNPANVNENLFVDVSSPSSSQFASVADLGTPSQAAKRTLDQVPSAVQSLLSLRRA